MNAPALYLIAGGVAMNAAAAWRAVEGNWAAPPTWFCFGMAITAALGWIAACEDINRDKDGKC